MTDRQTDRLGRTFPWGTKQTLLQGIMIVDKFIGQLNEQIADRDVSIKIEEDAAQWLQKRGYKPEFGAREMSRIIHKHIKQPLADLMLFGALQKGGIARVKTKEIDDNKTELLIVPEPLEETKEENAEPSETQPTKEENGSEKEPVLTLPEKNGSNGD